MISLWWSTFLEFNPQSSIEYIFESMLYFKVNFWSLLDLTSFFKGCLSINGLKVYQGEGQIQNLSILTHLHPELRKEVWWFWKYFSNKNIFLKTFEKKCWSEAKQKLAFQCLWTFALFSNYFHKYMSGRWYLLTIPMLRLLSSKAQGCKDFWKPFKPSLRVLNKSYPMNTNITGFRWFSKILASLCFGEK